MWRKQLDIISMIIIVIIIKILEIFLLENVVTVIMIYSSVIPTELLPFNAAISWFYSN